MMKRWPLSVVSVFTLLAACTQVPSDLPGIRTTATGYLVQDLGTPGQATDVSADGSVIVGHDGGSVFRWSPVGVQNLGRAGPNETPDLSADGQVVVWNDEDDSGRPQAFRWTVPTGVQKLGNFSANALSADGSVVVGTAYDNATDALRAVRWTAPTGLQNLSGLDGRFSEAVDVSAGGTAVVGNLDKFEDNHSGFRWTASGGPQNLGGAAFVTHVSADGKVVVGFNRGRAYRWTSSMGTKSIGTLGGPNLRVTDVSTDGSVVVGWNDTDSQGDVRAFRWTAAGGMKSLGTLLDRANSEAFAASADGSVVVGRSSTPGFGNSLAFRWTPAGGMQELPALLGGSAFAAAVSADGQVSAGLSTATGSTDVRAVRWGLGEGPEPKRYTADFQQAPLNRVLFSLKTGAGITGPSSPGSIAVYGERRIGGVIREGNHAKALELWGGKRLAITTANTATPNPGGGPLRLRFYPGFGDGLVRVKQLRVFNIVSDGATLTLFRRTQPVRQLYLPQTGPGKGVTISLDEPNVTTIRIDAPNAFAVDDVVFEDE